MGLGERAAEHSEVLGEHVYQPAVDPAVAGDDTVTQEFLVGETEVGRSVGNEAVQLYEGPGVQEQIQPLPRGELALLVLLFDPLLASALL